MSEGSEPKREAPRPAERWLARADEAVYLIVAALFLGAAVAMTGYAVLVFARDLANGFPLDLIAFINDLLLVLIILEVLGTVRSYLSTGATSLTPFLYIGIISATRRILAIGAESTLGGGGGETAFRQRMIDLGLNGAVVLALASALYLFGRQAARRETDGGERADRYR